MNKFTFLKVYFSPFKIIKPIFYIGKIRYGTPYFYPRRWVENKETGYFNAVPKKIGFDFIDLGWKTKWYADDYRHEWNPIWSFVFLKWQIAIIFHPIVDASHYWECWLYYSRNTDKTKSTKERIKDARDEFPCIWESFSSSSGKETICYWDKVLKEKYII